MLNQLNVVKKVVATTVALSIALPLPYARADANPLNAINKGQYFNPKDPMGAAANALLNPMSNSIKQYDSCFPAELRLQTRIYNPLIDPAVKATERMQEFQKKLEQNRKIFTETKPVKKECKDRNDKKNKESKDCQDEWARFDKENKENKKKQKEYTDKQIEQAKADMDLPDALNWDTLEINRDSQAAKRYSTETLLNKLETMASEDCLSFGIDQLPTPISCTNFNKTSYKNNLMRLIQIEKKALSCQKNHVKAIADVATCLTNKSASIQQNVQMLSGQFDAVYRQHADTLTVLDNHRKERKRVLDEVVVREILRGEGDGSNGKMYQMQKELNDLLTRRSGIWDKSADIKTKLMNLEQDTKNAKAFYEADVARTAINIFITRTKQLNDGSSPTLPAYYQSVMSRTNQSLSRQGEMQTRTVDIAGALSSVFGQVPDPASTAVGPSGNSGGLRTKADIKAAISARFGQMQFLLIGNSYKSLAQDMNAEIEECFQLANAKNSGPYLRRENAINGKDGIETKRLALLKEIQEGVADARSVFVKASNVLRLPKATPEQYGVDMNACLGNGSNIQAMINCFDTFKVYMYGLSQGNPQMASVFPVNSRFVPLQNLSALPPQTIATLGLSMKGSQPLKAQDSISCLGLDRCIEAIERYKNRLLTDINDLKSDHEKYTNAATQHIEGFGMQLSNMGNPALGLPSLQSATNDLNTKIASLQNELSSFGVSISTEIPLIPQAEWSPISGDNNPLNGFVQRPKDPISAVAGGTIDFRKNPFGALTKGTVDANKEISKKSGEINKYLTKMGEDEKKCGDEAKTAIENLKKTALERNGCLLLHGGQGDVSRAGLPLISSLDLLGENGSILHDLKKIINKQQAKDENSVFKNISGCSALMPQINPRSGFGEMAIMDDDTVKSKLKCIEDPKDNKKVKCFWDNVELSEDKVEILRISDIGRLFKDNVMLGVLAKFKECRDQLKLPSGDENCAEVNQSINAKVIEYHEKYKKLGSKAVSGSGVTTP
ncbi:MAG: hypothetical protein KA715_12280 [Xanthomonadaceae bacterium]|nr:hypothetical protein [Xanthomonadaceae bacterium]